MKRGLTVITIDFCKAYEQMPSSSKNYVMEVMVNVAGKTNVARLSGLPVNSANRNISCFGRLGHPFQTVSWQASLKRKDFVDFQLRYRMLSAIGHTPKLIT